MAAVFASLFTVAALVRAPLDEIANPADASYIPRPEWYFLSLFQLLKYFPARSSRWRRMVLPGVVVGFLLLLPFLDRGSDRHPLGRPRRWLTAALRHYRRRRDRADGRWASRIGRRTGRSDCGLLPIAGQRLAENSGCERCHVAGGAASRWPPSASPKTMSGCCRTWPIRW